MHSIVYKRVFGDERHNSYLATSSTAACRSRDLLSCSPLLITARHCLLFVMSPDCAKRRAGTNFLTPFKPSKTMLCSVRQKFNSSLADFYSAQQRDVAVGGLLPATGGCCIGNQSFPPDARIQNHAQPNSRAQECKTRYPPSNTFYSAETDVSDRQECPNGL